MQKKVDCGVAEVKKLCVKGELPCKMTDGGHYKIEVYDNAVPLEQYEKVAQENAVMKTLIKQFIQTGSEVVERS